MKNGDRLTGSVVKLDGKNLLFKSEYAGPIAVPWDAVAAVSSSDPVSLTLKDGQLVIGVVSTSDGKFVVQTKDAGTVSAARESVTMIRSQAEQAEVERYKNPRITDLWAGFLDFGYAATSGNSTTNNLAVSANATRATTRDKISVYFTSVHSSSKSVLTANAMRGGINYSLNLRPRLFVFGGTDLEFDEFQRLDLRFSPAGGFGFHAAKTENALFDIFGGAALNREFFSNGLNRTSGEILIGEELNYKLSKITSMHERWTFYPNLSRTGEYRSNLDISAATAVKKWLSWQVSASDRLLSNPLRGLKRNDLIFTTGVRVTFAK